MKKFLYINKETLTSFISQFEDGLITNKNENESNGQENKKKNIAGIDANAKASAKIFGQGIGANIDSNIESEREKNAKSNKSITLEKIMLDNLFDRLNKHLEANQLLEKNSEIGDFVKSEEEMHIVDLEYYKNIFSTGSTVLDFVKQQEVNEELNNIEFEVSGNGNKASYDKGKKEKEIKKQIDDKYNEIYKMLQAILNIIPYNKFGIMGEYLVSLDDNFFRDKQQAVAFKYGGEMTLFGYITNIINDETNTNDSNIFSTFPSIINSFMLSFFNKKEIKIVHPIAIYY